MVILKQAGKFSAAFRSEEAIFTCARLNYTTTVLYYIFTCTALLPFSNLDDIRYLSLN